MIIEHDVTIRHEQYNIDEIEVRYKGEYVKFVRERTGTLHRNEYGFLECSKCGEDLPSFFDIFPASYCPFCGIKVVHGGR